MNLTKLIVCVASFASVSFASDGFFEDKENGVPGAVQAVRLEKRGRPAGGDVSVNKFMHVDREVLGDLTNKGDSRPIRYRKPNSLIALDYIDGQPGKFKKATADVLDTRKKLEVKRPAKKRKSLIQSAAVFEVLSDNSTGQTTSAEGSISSRASSPAFLAKDDVADVLNQSFDDALGLGFCFDENEGVDPRITIFASPVAPAAVAVAPQTPVVANEEWREVLGLIGQDATPFEMGGSYKGQIYTPFNLATYVSPFLRVAPFSPLDLTDGEFERLVVSMSTDETLF